MNNRIQAGDVLELTAPYAVDSGDGALIGGIFGVACTDIASGDDGQFATVGVYALAKKSSQAWTQGDLIYWDNSQKETTTDGTKGRLIGAAVVAAGSSDATGKVRLNGNVQGVAEGPQAAIPDLDLTTLTDSPATADALRDNLTSAWETAIEGKVNAILAVMRTRGDIAP